MKIVDVDLGSNSYSVNIGKLSQLSFDKKVAIVTNPTVSGLHLGYLLNRLDAKELYIVTIPDGESHKNLATVQNILDRLFEHKFNRSSLVIAFGGGVIGDMSGFASSIYQRGIEFIQIPTTLLSQVDASVGGKTGVNNQFGKNLIGAFHQPKAVHIDTSFLSTLPKREFSAGVAEIVKMAVTFDLEFFEWLENNRLDNRENLEYAIQKSVEIKAKVVIEDEKEKGLRALLNYGHTFCHIVENQTNYSKYLHGEAVSIGINMANSLANSLGFMSKDNLDRVNNLLLSYDLPIDYIVEDIENFYSQFFLDKKSMDSKIKFIIPNEIGSAKIYDDISRATLLDVLSKFSK